MTALLKDYRLQLSLPECNHFVTSARALVDLSDDISEVLPYLNAILPRAAFNPNAPVLVFEHGGKRIALRPREVAIAPVDNEADARREMDWLTETINSTWERRAQIDPSYRVAKQLKMLDVYRLLPGGNCRACGEATCIAFAAKVAKREADVDACTPLCEPCHADKRRQLLEMVSDAG